MRYIKLSTNVQVAEPEDSVLPSVDTVTFRRVMGSFASGVWW
jgi:hypothetical protein